MFNPTVSTFGVSVANHELACASYSKELGLGSRLFVHIRIRQGSSLWYSWLMVSNPPLHSDCITALQQANTVN